MKTPFPLVSCIVVNWNGGKVFQDCLATLKKITYPNWELILVDNGSNDGSEEYPQKYKLPLKSYHLIKNTTNVGFAPANNQALEKAKGKYVLLLNNDTKVTPEFLQPLVEKLDSEEQVAALQPKIYLMDSDGLLDNAGSFLTWTGFLRHWGYMKKDSPEFAKQADIFSPKGACVLIRKSVIDEIGLFDADFGSYFEETDFAWRVWLSGKRILYYPKSHIFHKLGYTARRLSGVELNYNNYKNRIASFIKNLEFGNLLMLLTFHIVVSLGLLISFLVIGKFKNALMIIRAYVWNFKNRKSTWEKRKLIQKMRKVPDSKLFTTIMWPIKWGDYFQSFKILRKDLEK
ncbi:MAG: glycosyltransferase family 2 protein [Patescibacteria group bacterium]